MSRYVYNVCVSQQPGRLLLFTFRRQGFNHLIFQGHTVPGEPGLTLRAGSLPTSSLRIRHDTNLPTLD